MKTPFALFALLAGLLGPAAHAGTLMNTSKPADLRLEIGDKGSVWYADHFEWDPADDIRCGSYMTKTDENLGIASLEDVGPNLDLPRRALSIGYANGKVKVYLSCIKVNPDDGSVEATVATNYRVRVGGDESPNHPTAVTNLRVASKDESNIVFAWDEPTSNPYGVLIGHYYHWSWDEEPSYPPSAYWIPLDPGVTSFNVADEHGDLYGQQIHTLKVCTLNFPHEDSLVEEGNNYPEHLLDNLYWPAENCYFGEIGYTDREVSAFIPAYVKFTTVSDATIEVEWIRSLNAAWRMRIRWRDSSGWSDWDEVDQKPENTSVSGSFRRVSYVVPPEASGATQWRVRIDRSLTTGGGPLSWEFYAHATVDAE